MTDGSWGFEGGGVNDVVLGGVKVSGGGAQRQRHLEESGIWGGSGHEKHESGGFVGDLVVAELRGEGGAFNVVGFESHIVGIGVVP